MIWITIGIIVLFLFLARFFFIKYPQDLCFQWYILSGRDHDKVKELVRRRQKHLEKDEYARFFSHDNIKYHKGRIYLPLSLYFFLGFPVIRLIPMSIMWFFLNIQYKWKLKGRGLLWPVPKTILINEHMNNETVPKDE